MMRFLYQILYAKALLLAAPWLLLRRGRHYLETLPGRLGRDPGALLGTEPMRGGLWIHAVSVGEVAVAATLVRRLPTDLPLVVTTVTPTGQARARELFADRADVAYLPFDLGFAVRRFFARFEPVALVLVEGDYWPLVLSEARRRGLPVAVVNGRMSERSFARLRRLGGLVRRLFFAAVARFGVQTDEDRRRLLELGVEAERVVVTGNLKYDSPEPPPLPELEASLRRRAGGRAILLAGSTMRGEEEAVLDAFERLGPDRALLVVAPRHPERWDAVARLFAERGLAFLRRSREAEEAGEGADEGTVDAVLLDSLGELASIYRAADAAFIGGTLVPTGGHNPLEPARFDVPIVVGPSMENFREMADAFDAGGAWRRATDAEALAEVWREWIENPAAAREVGRCGGELLRRNRGAVERTVELLEERGLSRRG